MKKTLSILLSMVLILTLFPLSGFEANATATPDPPTTSDDLNNASNWVTYNSQNKNGWWGAPEAIEYNGKSAIKVNSMNILVSATKLVVDKNTDYTISFEYCGSVKNPKALKTVGISTLTNGEIVYKTSGDIYDSGEIGDSNTVWTTISFEFNSGANTELEFFIHPSAGSDTYSANPLYLANFSIEKLEGLNLVSNWTVLRSAGTVIDWMVPKTVSATKDGKSIHAIQIKGNSAGSYVSSFDAKQKHMYRLSFDYYSENFAKWDNSTDIVFNSCGVAPLNAEGKLHYRTYTTNTPPGIFTINPSFSFDGSADTRTNYKYDSIKTAIKESADHWYNISFEFCSGANDKLEFYINPASLTGDAPIDLANFKLEDLGAYTSADKLNANENLYNSCGSIKHEAVRKNDQNTGFRLPYIGSGIEFKVKDTDNVKVGFKLPTLSTFKDYSNATSLDAGSVTKYNTLRMKVWVTDVATNEVIEKDVLINGQYDTTEWLTVAENLDPNKTYTIKLVRATEASLGDTLILMGVLSGDGNLVDVTKTTKPYIEVYGDSISSGYGNIASNTCDDFYDDTNLYSWVKDGVKVEENTPDAAKNFNVSEYDFEDGTKTYAYLAAQNLGADINVFSKSGLGITVAGGKAGDDTVTMAKWYDDSLQSIVNEKADYVIINHITNDSKYYPKANLDQDGLVGKYVEFIKKVRDDHANAKIIVIYGMMRITSSEEDYYKTGEEVVLKAVNEAKKEDKNVYALMLPKGGKGGAGHPDGDEHIAASKLLTEFINGLGVIETQNSVGIRAKSTDKGQGIRVRNSISKAEFAGKNIVSYGAIAIRKGRIMNNDVSVPLTFDTSGIATGVAYNTKEGNCGGKTQNTPILREETETDNIFSCVLIKIPQRYYGDKYSVRSFAIDDAGNVYYGEVVEVSVFDVVHAIFDKASASQNDKNTANSIVKEIIDANSEDPSIPTYKQWCQNNGFDDNSNITSQN